MNKLHSLLLNQLPRVCFFNSATHRCYQIYSVSMSVYAPDAACGRISLEAVVGELRTCSQLSTMSEASVRDRTREFFLTTNSVRDRLGLANAKPPQPLQQRKRFSQKAAQIGKDIHRTAEKLNKLTKRESRPTQLRACSCPAECGAAASRATKRTNHCVDTAYTDFLSHDAPAAPFWALTQRVVQLRRASHSSMTLPLRSLSSPTSSPRCCKSPNNCTPSDLPTPWFLMNLSSIRLSSCIQPAGTRACVHIPVCASSRSVPRPSMRR